jgi:hypothetical protein
MEGPALAFKVMVLLAIVMAIYRRFERHHAPFPDFERFIASRPVLVAIRSRAASDVAARLRDVGAVFAGTGLRPWPFYSLRVAIEQSHGVVFVRADACALLRVEGTDPPELLDVVRDALDGAGADVWFHAGTWVDLDDGRTAPGGWLLGSGVLTPCDEVPTWASPASATMRSSDLPDCAPAIE